MEQTQQKDAPPKQELPSPQFNQTKGPGTMGALRALGQAGLMEPLDVEVLADAYRFCMRVRNRLFLRTGRVGDSLPADPEEATRLARSLEYAIHPRSSLREDYRRMTRRARRTVDRLFYGLDGPGSTPQA